MRVVQIDDYGGPELLVSRDIETPRPQAGEVLIKLDYAGVSFTDIYRRRGYYKAPHTYATHLPYTPGVDGVGRVAGIGDGVSGFSVGDYVTYTLGRNSYAEYVVMPAWKVVHLPAEFPAQIACALITNGLTAFYLSHDLFPLGPDNTCLIHAGAGSVGQLLIQLAHLRGARVITTVGSSEKEKIVRDLGVDTAILYREVDFVAAVREATDGEGVDVAYDSVGLDTYRDSMRCVKRRGLCALYGAASGIPDCVRPMEDLAENGSIFVTRSHFAHYMTDHAALTRASKTVFEAYNSGRLKAAIDPRTFTLAQAADAHRALESRRVAGKILLKVS